MKILGLANDVWISSAALVSDGKVVAACAEERFNRQKMSKVFPRRSIEFCLKQAGCSLGDIDRIVFGWNPAVHLRSVSSRYIDVQRWRGEYLYMLPGALMSYFGSPEVNEFKQTLKTKDWDAHIHFVNHHDAHVASAYFLSPFREAAVFTVDGRGEEETCTFNLARNSSVERLASVKMPHSLGLFYAAITEFLGFKPHTDEWKVMALASYGRSEGNEFLKRMRSLIALLPDGGFEQDLTYFTYYSFDKQPFMFSEKLERLLGKRRKPSDGFEQSHMDLAWSLQTVFEEATTHMLLHLHKITGSKNLAIAGGAAMNSVYNGKISAVTPFKNVFIPSCPDDSGVSVGAALYGHHILGAADTPHKAQTHNYWGPSFSEREIGLALDRYKIRAQQHADIVDVTAKLLSEGKIVGWFQGAAEFGQRALGNRSILADPRDPGAKDKVNAAVKFREGFRPFAPAILAERAEEYFEMPKGMAVPFMERVFLFRENKRRGLPGVVHIDGTGRLQTVTADANPRFYALIAAFERLTGVPIVLNTSFNLNGEPMVCSPEDAIRSFYTCGLDALVLGNHLVIK